jgi:hypothetical protein
MADRRVARRGWALAFAAPLVAVIAVVLVACSSTGQRTGGAPAADVYSFWPPPPDEPRVQFLRAFAVSSDVEPNQGALERIVFGDDLQVLPISKPYGVEMWENRLYVCDITNPGVVILDLEKQQTRIMTARGVEQMLQPTDLAIAPDGTKYVVDRRLGRIFVFNADDRHVTTFGESGLVPAGVAVYGDELFVPDLETQRVVVFDRIQGTQLRTIGGPGGDEGEFIAPLGIDVGPDGGVYVGDAIRGRYQHFDRDGNLMLALGQIGDTPGSFTRPKHVAVDEDGVVFVVDAAFQNVQMFDADGGLLMFFGGPGNFDGSMSLPAGITVYDEGLEHFSEYVHPAFEPRRLVVVTNQFGRNKVSVYALGQLREGRTVEDIMPYAAEFYAQPAQGIDLPPADAPPDAESAPPDDAGEG